MGRTFIESENFPISVVNNASAKEKGGGGRPPYWEMVFWWTRKPLAGARAVITGSLLAGEVDSRQFVKWIYPFVRFRDEGYPCKPRKKGESPPPFCFQKMPHVDNPRLPSNVKEELKKVRLLDQFAGFGSIPLEAIRLGIGDVVAVEFLPTAYIFLKAILEYSKIYSNIRVRISGKEVKELKLDSVIAKLVKAKKIVDYGVYEVPSLIYDVAKWGKWVVEKLREDQDIKELYDEDVAVYIGTWEVKCPNTLCNRYTPLVGNWWLAKVRDKKYAYMKPKVECDKVNIEIVEGKTEGVPSPNVRGRPELAECLLCGSRITYIDPKTGRVYGSKSEVGNNLIRKRSEFYPKHAIREWNQKLEEYLEGRISLEELKSAKARPRLLVKVKIVNKDLKFEPCNEEDNEKLWKALEKLKQMWGDPDIPVEPIPPYGNIGGGLRFPVYAVSKWYQFFNPRQLLALVKLVKLIREAGKKVEEEKLKEGWSREEAFNYAEAVTTYLAIALARYVTFNSVTATIRADTIMGAIVAGSLTFRGIAMVWNYGEITPYADITGSWIRNNSVKIKILSNSQSIFRLYPKTHVMYHWMRRIVTERDVLELDLTLNRRKINRVGAIHDLRRGIQ